MSQVLSPWGYLPDGWNLSTIDEEKTALFDYVANGSFASLAENVKYRETPDYAVLIRLVDYNNNFSGDFVYIDEHAYNFLSKSKLYGDEIIISNVGANVGTVFKAPRLNKKMSLAPNAICVKFKGCNDFYYYWLRSRIGQHIINSLVSGSAQPKFNKTHFRSMPIPVPPIEIQENIASILSSLDDKIAVNRRICENLEAQAQALFKHWFIDFAPFKNGNFVESELGMIPEGWRVGKFGDIADLIKPSIKPIENVDYSHYSIPAFDNNRIPSKDNGGTIKSNKFVIHDSVTLLSKLNPDHKRIWFVSKVGTNAICSTELLPFYAKDREQSAFVYCYLNCWRNYREIANGAKGTTNSHQRIDANAILSRKLAYDKDTISIFCNLVRDLLKLENKAIQESIYLSQLRDTLLPKLMSGQIKV